MASGAQHYTGAQSLLDAVSDGVNINDSRTLAIIAVGEALLAQAAATMYEHTRHMRELDPHDKTLADWVSALQKEN